MNQDEIIEAIKATRPEAWEATDEEQQQAQATIKRLIAAGMPLASFDPEAGDELLTLYSWSLTLNEAAEKALAGYVKGDN